MLSCCESIAIAKTCFKSLTFTDLAACFSCCFAIASLFCYSLAEWLYNIRKVISKIFVTWLSLFVMTVIAIDVS